MHEITVIESTKPIGRKEQLESGKKGEKSHNEGKILEHQLEDSPPWQHSPPMNHY
jgi:hypothetical protein